MERALAAAGCVAADEEAAELVARAADDDELASLVARRVSGEPLAWITGSAPFCGLDIVVEPGVYVPRWQSEPLARRAADLLPVEGTAVDLCTGSGAVARVLGTARPAARVVGTDLDPVAHRCALRNGVDARLGHLFDPLPVDLLGAVDVVVGVVPYVPTDALHLLPRDVVAFEPGAALDGGEGGTVVVAEVIVASTGWLRSGGWLLLEVGGDQIAPVRQLFDSAGFVDVSVLTDGDGDPRAVEGRVVGTARGQASSR